MLEMSTIRVKALLTTRNTLPYCLYPLQLNGGPGQFQFVPQALQRSWYFSEHSVL
jgi:hypothetical protein